MTLEYFAAYWYIQIRPQNYGDHNGNDTLFMINLIYLNQDRPANCSY